MNERIKKCLTQAGIYDGREGLYWCSQEQLEKFAESIVKECIGLTDGHGNIRPEDVQKHFGVE